jgi:hypothetical protein
MQKWVQHVKFAVSIFAIDAQFVSAYAKRDGHILSFPTNAVHPMVLFVDILTLFVSLWMYHRNSHMTS